MISFKRSSFFLLTSFLLAIPLQAHESKSLYEERFTRGIATTPPRVTKLSDGSSLIDATAWSAVMMQQDFIDNAGLNAEQSARAGQLEKALEELTTILSTKTEAEKSVRLYLDKATINADLGHYDMGLLDCNAAIKIDKPILQWRGLWLKALIFKQAGNEQLFLKTLKQAVAYAKAWESNDVYVRDLRLQLSSVAK